MQCVFDVFGHRAVGRLQVSPSKASRISALVRLLRDRWSRRRDQLIRIDCRLDRNDGAPGRGSASSRLKVAFIVRRCLVLALGAIQSRAAFKGGGCDRNSAATSVGAAGCVKADDAGSSLAAGSARTAQSSCSRLTVGAALIGSVTAEGARGSGVGSGSDSAATSVCTSRYRSWRGCLCSGRASSSASWLPSGLCRQAGPVGLCGWGLQLTSKPCPAGRSSSLSSNGISRAELTRHRVFGEDSSVARLTSRGSGNDCSCATSAVSAALV